MSNQSTYRFVLQPYTDRGSRYDCPHCGAKKKFTRYIDQVTGEHLDPAVGKCDRINTCGYHYPPAEYFKDNPNEKVRFRAVDPEWVDAMVRKKESEQAEVPRLIIDRQYLLESRSEPARDHLMQFLIGRLGEEEAMRLHTIYQIGTWHHGEEHSTIFWQIDKLNQIRAGKIIRYDPVTGHRLHHIHPTWIHKELPAYRQRSLRLDQCLFGEHLLNGCPDKSVALVESEKTAMLCASAFPGYLWLATGGLQAFTPERLKVLKGRDIMAFPDLKAYDHWFEKACQTDLNIRLFRYLELLAPEHDLDNGLDVADYLPLRPFDSN